MHALPPVDHLVALTDDVGILQHATLDVPNRSCGYCTDDVGRALIVACDIAARVETAAPGAQLVRTYLAYLHDAQLADGWFHGFMGYDRRWQDHAGTADQVGRALWGLGYAEALAPQPSWRLVARRLRVKSLPVVGRLGYPRAIAYAILGLVRTLEAEPDDRVAVRAAIDAAAAELAERYDEVAAPDWRWCEDVLTYDNARLAEALLRAGIALDQPRYVRTGLAMLEFYVGVSIEDGLYVPVGSEGWFRRGGIKARFGQQPLEAAALVDAALVAFDLTARSQWRDAAEIAHRWFLGGNVHGIVLARDGGGCCDGLDATGVNPNMGAESTLAYLGSAIALARHAPLQLAR